MMMDGQGDLAEDAATQTTPASVPTLHDAAARRAVRLADGRTGRLLFAARYGNSAKVQLPGGAVIATHRSTLTLIEEDSSDDTDTATAAPPGG